MLKEHTTFFRRLLIAFDVIVASAGFLIAFFARGHSIVLAPLAAYAPFLPFFIITWLSFFHFYGMYWSFRTERIPTVLFIIVESAGLGFMAFGSILYLLKLHDFSRQFLVAAFAVTGVLFAVEKICLIYFFRYIRKKGLNYRGLLVVGTGTRAKHFIEHIEQHSEWGFRVVGLIDMDPTYTGHFIHNHQVLGTLADIPRVVHSSVVDEVIFIVPRSWLDRIEEAVIFCETEGLKVHLAEDFFNLKFSRIKQTEFNGFPLLTFESTPDKFWQLFFKRVFDLTASAVALLALLPVFAAIAIAIRMTSPGPVLFRQVRSGRNGRKFVLNKFRTMEQDAESKLSTLLTWNEMTGPVFKMEKDPRVTTIGKFLRKLSLDELPQLWNVFKGDMSIVGPRPPLPSEVEKYDSWQRRRLSMKPGITCIWQASGRNRINDFSEWAKLDLEYIDRWSIWLDFKLVAQTVPAVLLGVGAK